MSRGAEDRAMLRRGSRGPPGGACQGASSHAVAWPVGGAADRLARRPFALYRVRCCEVGAKTGVEGRHRTLEALAKGRKQGLWCLWIRQSGRTARSIRDRRGFRHHARSACRGEALWGRIAGRTVAILFALPRPFLPLDCQVLSARRRPASRTCVLLGIGRRCARWAPRTGCKGRHPSRRSGARARYGPCVLRGQRSCFFCPLLLRPSLGGFCVTPPGGGSDMSATRAGPQRGGWPSGCAQATRCPVAGAVGEAVL